ncbi:MAG: hypothetical protein KatS3mg096_606 [Candidatus Parcubacteria bacterium]|nr:MAG: hypothetical protein KatS3mg096_606 [Candidatus Parcubacteria bacterium]
MNISERIIYRDLLKKEDIYYEDGFVEFNDKLNELNYDDRKVLSLGEISSRNYGQDIKCIFKDILYEYNSLLENLKSEEAFYIFGLYYNYELDKFIFFNVPKEGVVNYEIDAVRERGLSVFVNIEYYKNKIIKYIDSHNELRNHYLTFNGEIDESDNRTIFCDNLFVIKPEFYSYDNVYREFIKISEGMIKVLDVKYLYE